MGDPALYDQMTVGPYVGDEHIATAGFEPATSSSFILGIGPSLQTESLFSGEFSILHAALSVRIFYPIFERMSSFFIFFFDKKLDY